MAALQPLDEESRERVLMAAEAYFSGGARTTRRTAPLALESDDEAREPEQRFGSGAAPTPKQFMLEKRPQTDIERVACLAYYLTHYRDQLHFKTFDLSKLNTEAAQIKFSNAAQAAANALKAVSLRRHLEGPGRLAPPESSSFKLFLTARRQELFYRISESDRRDRIANPKDEVEPGTT